MSLAPTTDPEQRPTRLLSRRSASLLIAVLCLGGAAVDQGTKLLALRFLTPGRPIPLVSDILQLFLLRNAGAAFSTGESLTIVFSLLALVALVVIIAFVVPRVRSRIWAVAVGLALAGVLGNFIDRLFRAPSFLRGHVIDFLSLKHFAVFNVADMMLTAAAVLVVVCALFLKLNLDGKVFADEKADRADKATEPAAADEAASQPLEAVDGADRAGA